MNVETHESITRGKAIVAVAVGAALLGTGAWGWGEAKVMGETIRRRFLLRILAEELEKDVDISKIECSSLRKKTLQLKTENQELIERMVEILVVADGGIGAREK